MSFEEWEKQRNLHDRVTNKIKKYMVKIKMNNGMLTKIAHERLGLKLSTATGRISGFLNSDPYFFIPHSREESQTKLGELRLKRLAILFYCVHVPKDDKVIQELKNKFYFVYPPKGEVPYNHADNVNEDDLITRINKLSQKDQSYIKWLIDSF